MKIIFFILLFFLSILNVFSQEIESRKLSDSIIKVQELEVFYFKKSNVFRQKHSMKVVLGDDTLVISEFYQKSSDKFSNSKVIFKDKKYRINDFYKNTYKCNMHESLYFMENKVYRYFSKSSSYIEIDFYTWGCLGEFCLEADVLVIQISSDNNFLSAFFYEKVYELND
jgi:hypothetical protein